MCVFVLEGGCYVSNTGAHLIYFWAFVCLLYLGLWKFSPLFEDRCTFRVASIEDS